MRVALILGAAWLLAVLAWIFVSSRPPVVATPTMTRTKIATTATAPVAASSAAAAPAPRASPPAIVDAAAAAPAAAPERTAILAGTILRGECEGGINACVVSERGRECQVTDDGRFELAVAPGSYRIVAVCQQLVAEHVGEIYVEAGERVDGLRLELLASGVIGLTLELPPGSEDEDVEVRSDPPSHDLAHAVVRFAADQSRNQPIGPLPAGKVHLSARGRCVGGERDVEVAPGPVVTKVTWLLESRPCVETGGPETQ